jgi:myo-inositol-1(or 4)-monophosphatase
MVQENSADNRITREIPFQEVVRRPEGNVAIQAVVSAGDRLESFGREIVERKPGFENYATRGDFGSQDIILQIIRASFPTDHILSEETKDTLPQKVKRRWIVDPIDGSVNFRHGRLEYVVAVSLEEDENTVLTAVYDPQRKLLYYAEQGNGAYVGKVQQGQVEAWQSKLSVSQVHDFKDAHAFTDSYYDPLYLEYHLAIRKHLGIQWINMPGTTIYSLAQVAGGSVDLYYHGLVKPWDRAPGLLVTEAGGMVRRFNGLEGTIASPDIVAGNSILVEKYIQAMKTLSLKGRMKKFKQFTSA